MEIFKKTINVMVFLILMALTTHMALAQQGKATGEPPESLQVDALIDAFFTLRTGDLDEMLGMHQIRVLVVLSRSTYFLDKEDQPRGMDYELLKGYPSLSGNQFFGATSTKFLGNWNLRNRHDEPSI